MGNGEMLRNGNPNPNQLQNHNQIQIQQEKKDKEEDNKNPWFNDEIAAIVKLHRKTIRKYHRSKTKKVELKQMCKELEKKKRKLIKAAKQQHAQINGHGQQQEVRDPMNS